MFVGGCNTLVTNWVTKQDVSDDFAIILSGLVGEIASPAGHFLPIDCHQQIDVEISNISKPNARIPITMTNN